jgi:BON domain
MMVELKRISTALGLLAALSTSALAQGPTPNGNQLTADSVAGTLRASSDLAGNRIEIEARDGVVTLTGELGSPAQKAEALARTQYVAGVRGVVDHLRVANENAIRTVQYQPNPALAYRPGIFGHQTGQSGGDIIYGGGTGAPVNGGMINGGTINGAPSNGGPMTSGPSSDGGPMPEGPAGMTGATQAAQPGYPNYAWPSYAPYPNFSAVGYPTAYPWQAWPNIGPFYPYPEVPQDWRAVTLRWDDGIWWLDFKKHYTRPFFTPYPFGLFAY